MKLFLDDVRDPPDSSWVISRTVDEAIKLLQTGNVEIVSLDHDMGDGEKTGYDLMVWVEESVILNNFTLPKIIIHSSNPVGRKRMQMVCDSIRRRQRTVLR